MGLISSLKSEFNPNIRGSDAYNLKMLWQTNKLAFAAPFAPIIANVPIIQTAAVSTLGKVSAVVKGTVAKYGLPKTVLGATALTIVAKSSKGKEALVNAPKSFNTFTSNTASFIDNPSLETASKIAKDNPLTTALAVGGTSLVLGGAALKTGAPLVSYFAYKNALESGKEKEKIINVTPERVTIQPVENQPSVTLPSSGAVGKPNSSSPIPAAPPIAPIEDNKSSPAIKPAGTTKRRKRAKKCQSKAKSIKRLDLNFKAYGINA